jgi:hypothetical protein
MPWSDTPTSNGRYKKVENNGVDFGKVALVFFIFSLIGFVTAAFFSFDKEEVVRDSFSFGTEAMSGPIYVKKHHETYNIDITANIPRQTWMFLEGEVLDDEKEYLFAFGKELWHETGYDGDGAWRENKNHYNIKVTFPNPGSYYLNFKTENAYSDNSSQADFVVIVRKKNGSSIPHLWFGILTLIIGIFLYEKQNKSITKFLEEHSG